MRIALELSGARPDFDDAVERLQRQFLEIVEATRAVPDANPAGFWDDADGWCYDVLRRPGHPDAVLRVRSIAGLIPLLAVAGFAAREAVLLRRTVR